MFNMVILIYITLHLSKYSINTVKKPSHNVYFQHWAFFVAMEGQEGWGKKSDIRTANLKRQDKEIQRFKSKTPADCLSLNNGTAWKS